MARRMSQMSTQDVDHMQREGYTQAVEKHLGLSSHSSSTGLLDRQQPLLEQGLHETLWIDTCFWQPFGPRHRPVFFAVELFRIDALPGATFQELHFVGLGHPPSNQEVCWQIVREMSSLFKGASEQPLVCKGALQEEACYQAFPNRTLIHPAALRLFSHHECITSPFHLCLDGHSGIFGQQVGQPHQILAGISLLLPHTSFVEAGGEKNEQGTWRGKKADAQWGQAQDQWEDREEAVSRRHVMIDMVCLDVCSLTGIAVVIPHAEDHPAGIKHRH